MLTCLATYSIIIIAVMYGFSICPWSWAHITLMHRRRGMTKRSRVFMGSAMGIIYITSGIHWSFNIYTFIREIRNPIAWAALPPEAIYNWSLITTSALFCGVSILLPCQTEAQLIDCGYEVLDQRHYRDVARCSDMALASLSHCALCDLNCRFGMSFDLLYHRSSPDGVAFLRSHLPWRTS